MHTQETNLLGDPNTKTKASSMHGRLGCQSHLCSCLQQRSLPAENFNAEARCPEPSPMASKNRTGMLLTTRLPTTQERERDTHRAKGRSTSRRRLTATSRVCPRRPCRCRSVGRHFRSRADHRHLLRNRLLSTRRSFDHHGKGNGNFVQKKSFKKMNKSRICH